VNSERKPDDVLRQWSRADVPPERDGANAGRRDRMISHIARDIGFFAEQRKRAKRNRALLAALSVAAAAILGIGWSLRHDNARSHVAATASGGAPLAELRGARGTGLRRQGAVLAVHDGFVLLAGDEVATSDDAQSSVKLASGAVVALGPQTRLRLVDTESVETSAGAVTVSVPKLAPSRAFVVHTPDARVLVHGTRFVISIATPAHAPRTLVRVIEGRVSVQYAGTETFVSAGESWPSSTAEAPQQAEPAGAARADTPREAPSASGSKSTPSGTRAISSSSAAPEALTPAALAEQNRMFSEAVAARRSGNDARAIALLEELLAKYPRTPLVPEVRVERFRALKRLGRSAEAAREASRYLLENENGAARDEAREVVLPSPAGGR
jgi:hypothetical protein